MSKDIIKEQFLTFSQAESGQDEKPWLPFDLGNDPFAIEDAMRGFIESVGPHH